MTIRVCFLDFDGVLNSVDTFTHYHALRGLPIAADERIDRGLVFDCAV